MKRVPNSRGGIACTLSSIFLLLTVFACNVSPEVSQGEATATPTASPAPVLPVATGGSYILEISWSGSYTPPNGLVTVTYGPNTARVHLEPDGDIYVGSYEGTFDAVATGNCTASGANPITFNVTAREGEFHTLDFTVNRSHVWSWSTICPGVSGVSTSPLITYTHTFTLPAEDGASTSFNQGGPTWTFTLKTQ